MGQSRPSQAQRTLEGAKHGPGLRTTPMKRLAILGSTGSIGQSTLSIVEQFPERYAVAALGARRNLVVGFAQTVRWRPKLVSLATEQLAAALSTRLREAGISGVEVVQGTE